MAHIRNVTVVGVNSVSVNIVGVNCVGVNMGVNSVGVNMGVNSVGVNDVNIVGVNIVAVNIVGVIKGNPVIEVNPLLELSRLIEVEERYFEYELTPSPTSLFKDNVMRTNKKSKLAQMLINSQLSNEERVTKTVFILDGGSLLRRVKWTNEKTYKEVFDRYHGYVRKWYKVDDNIKDVIIFDGYGSGPSTKDHKRRHGSLSSEVIEINGVNRPYDQMRLLANPMSKGQFIKQLSEYLKSHNHGVLQSEGDADTLIISEAIKRASRGEHVTVVSDDTDILVLLLYHWKTNMADIHLRSFGMKEGGIPLKLTSIRKATQYLKRPVRDHLLVIHAWGGCDTTSAIYKQGKNAILDLVKNSEDVQRWCEQIEQDDPKPGDVEEAGAKIFVKMYGGNGKDTLRKLRFERYQKNPAITISGMRPLPPTEGAALQHSLRVHLQVMEWKHLKLCQSQIERQNWGWVIKKDANKSSLMPIMTNQPIAPDNLLQHVICECQTSSQNPYRTNDCSCRERGFRCTHVMPACHCQGQGCGNESRKVHMTTRQMNRLNN